MGDRATEQTTARQLLALLRTVLWQKPVECEAFADSAPDWDAIRELASRHTVGGLYD